MFSLGKSRFGGILWRICEKNSWTSRHGRLISKRVLAESHYIYACIKSDDIEIEYSICLSLTYSLLSVCSPSLVCFLNYTYLDTSRLLLSFYLTQHKHVIIYSISLLTHSPIRCHYLYPNCTITFFSHVHFYR